MTTRAAPRAVVKFGHIVIIGGGCYGSWYAQQLARAAEHGALSVQRVTVIDRDPGCLAARHHAEGTYAALPLVIATAEWDSWLAAWLDDSEPSERAGDAIVPSPLMPHLLLDWLMHGARRRWPARTVAVAPLRAPPPMPWERAAPDGRHYVSFAEWMCPVNCIEPSRCPATRGPRSWSMPPALEAYVREENALGHPLRGPIIFHCSHRVWGVGMIDADVVVAADRLVAEAGRSGETRVLVGTVSHCHGALGVLHVS